MQKFFSFPVNCPWPSSESRVIMVEAVKKFYELCDANQRVMLIASSCWSTRGYWVEIRGLQERPLFNVADIVIMEKVNGVLFKMKSA